MIETKDYAEFYIKNLEDLKRIFKWKTHIHDEEIVEEAVSKFIIYIIEKNILNKYRPKKSDFHTFITTCFLNLVRVEIIKKNSIKRGGQLKRISIDDIDMDKYNQTEDIFDYCNIKQDWKIFLERTFKNKSVPERRKQILKYINKGMKVKDISKELNLSKQAVHSQIEQIRKLWDAFYK